MDVFPGKTNSIACLPSLEFNAINLPVTLVAWWNNTYLCSWVSAISHFYSPHHSAIAHMLVWWSSILHLPWIKIALVKLSLFSLSLLQVGDHKKNYYYQFPRQTRSKPASLLFFAQLCVMCIFHTTTQFHHDYCTSILNFCHQNRYTHPLSSLKDPAAFCQKLFLGLRDRFLLPHQVFVVFFSRIYQRH